MKKFYFLGTCNTCQRILNHLDLSEDFELKDIKKNPITSEELHSLSPYQAAMNLFLANVQSYIRNWV